MPPVGSVVPGCKTRCLSYLFYARAGPTKVFDIVLEGFAVSGVKQLTPLHVYHVGEGTDGFRAHGVCRRGNRRNGYVASNLLMAIDIPRYF